MAYIFHGILCIAVLLCYYGNTVSMVAREICNNLATGKWFKFVFDTYVLCDNTCYWSTWLP